MLANLASAEQAQAASGTLSLMWLLLAFPLVGALLLLATGKTFDKVGQLIGTLASSASFVMAVIFFFAMRGQGIEHRTSVDHLFSWIVAGPFKVDAALRLDQLSMVFVLLITGVGSLIHMYSIGYMEHDERRRRFFGYLNLFVASMLLLVLADNYLLLYVGWEGVGLASYLLIGFYQHKDSAATAAKKAFVMNRIGDLGLSVAIMIMFAAFGTVSFSGVAAAAGGASESTLNVIGLFLLLAACGKSAQFPLQAWLLDAMEGPTPVSALIHAATMVTAGVYLVTRSHFIYDAAPLARTFVVIVATITLLMGAAIGTAKDDIKKALAGSTMSQIGYMMLAAGLGPVGYVFAIFHLLVHGMFKAGLFLGAGSVMHGMNDQVDMRRYGALRGAMAVTFATFGLGFLAIIGIPPFAGFFSKDEIIHAAFSQNWLVGTAALLGAGVTAYYMTRLMAMTFFGTKRWTDDNEHPHESKAVMTIPMIVLAFGSVLSGIALVYWGDIEGWLAPVVGVQKPDTGPSSAMLIPITLLLVLAGVGLAFRQYALSSVPTQAPTDVSPLTVAARNDLYGDAVNETVFMAPGQYLTRFLVFFDNRVVDGSVNGLAAVIGAVSVRLRRLQTGFARSYALSMAGGAALVVIALLLVRL